MRAADGEDFGYAGDVCGGKHDVVAFAFRCRYDHNDFFHACDVGGHRVHDDGTRICRLAAWDVNADAVKRGNLLPQQRAVFIGVAPRFHFLALVVAFDTAGGGLQCCLNVVRNALERRVQIGLREY
ncbi:Uncharacterised protein [Neisseria gonorrhoeae]|uniref:Uncharacterized protein n=1 Tax=Neisseria gonorrhoeae TaxID=485 RepID=A0A378VV26_NEIGO|nr:Uncharacterised protein [Neisseria gonorrhoeae]